MTNLIGTNLEQMKAEIWEFGGRYDGSKPIPVTITPQYFSASSYNALISDSGLVLQALEVILALYCQHEVIQRRFPELSQLNEYICRTPVTAQGINLARFDYVKAEDGTLVMVEPNTDCPGGMTNASAVHRAFRNSVYYDSQVREASQASESPQTFLELMCSISGRNDPRVGFIWSKICPIKNDIFNLFESAKHMSGWSVPFLGPVQDLLPGSDGAVLADGLPMDVAFTKIDTTLGDDGKIHWCAWEDNIEEAQLILNALADGRLVTVSGLPSMMVAENKRCLALLFEPSIRQHFSKPQVDAIDRLVAKTSCIDGLTSEQLWSPQHVLTNKNCFVLKTPIDTRGRGIYIGKSCTEEEWYKLVDDAMAGHMVVQEYIPPMIEVLELDTGISEHMSTVMALFMYAGKPTGVLGRSSHKDVVNVGNGGVFRPTLVVHADETRQVPHPIFSEA
ncbi:hypothetical protein [Janthinobacterium fluminis]|uniref:Glutathionylspermidine synthase n=1 Tax=Janthinobacterium fluminis TaxID=2987524 RepID=A0ABT5JX58_9BURK|nr:hypothetical protein [Janthinobacterium fluminis]MDC8757306.1 hypothetical protein [Janthinobacterium fluminis]